MWDYGHKIHFNELMDTCLKGLRFLQAVMDLIMACK